MRSFPGSGFLLAMAAATGACSGGQGNDPQGTGRSAEALTGTPFYYLRCKSTDWSADNGSRLQAT